MCQVISQENFHALSNCIVTRPQTPLQQAVAVKSVPTKPIEGQKTGTSGLRKKTAVFTGENYLANWCCSPHCSTHMLCTPRQTPPHTPVLCRIQSLFDSLGDEVKGKTIAVGGDGRYFNKQAAQTIIKLAAGAGIKKVGILAVTELQH